MRPGAPAARHVAPCFRFVGLALLPIAILTVTRPALAQDAPSRPAAQREPGTGTTWNTRPTIQFGEHGRLEIHARLQTDYLVRNEADPDAAALTSEDRLSVARKRVGVEGELFGRVSFQVEGEIGDPKPWRDVYADVKIMRGLRVRAGHFKVPFSLEQLTSATDLDFVARSAAVSDLAPSRDLGVMVHGRLARKALKYETGLFEAGGATRLWAENPVRTLAGRITLAPLKDGASRGSDALEISAAMLRTDRHEGRDGPAGHTAMGQTFFHRMYVNGTSTRLGASAAWNADRASLRAELLRSIDTRIGQAVDGSRLSDLLSTGGYIAGIWHLVAGSKGDFPLRALDLTARLERLSFHSAATEDEPFLNPRANHVAPIGRDAVTGGVNWHLNRWIKLQGNVVRERVTDPLALLPISATPLWGAVVRFQVAM
jgi:phosphate-selective porin OprO/OprP